jgi:NADH dehydrogenase
LIGGGMTKFQPVYAGDVAEAAVRVLEREDACGQIFELGGPRIYTFRELLEMIMRITGRQRYLINLPWPVAMLEAFILEQLPHPLLTRDQVRLLKSDNIVRDARAKTFRDLGINPTSAEIIVPTYLR